MGNFLTSLFNPSATPATGSRLRADGMPDGFFLNDSVWFGDEGSEDVCVARGVRVEPDDLGAMDDAGLANQESRQREVLASLPPGQALQARWRVTRVWDEFLDAYAADTGKIVNRHRDRWGIWNRTDRVEHYRAAAHEGRVPRESLNLFFTRTVRARPPFALSEEGMAAHYDALSRREAVSFRDVQLNALASQFPDCRVLPMGDAEHFLHFYEFLNPGAGCLKAPDALRMGLFDDSLSIQANCLGDDPVQHPLPGVAFTLGGVHHAVLVMRRLPAQVGPGTILKLLNGLAFTDFEVVVNVYPQDADRVIKALNRQAAQLSGEARTNHKQRESLLTQLDMLKARIQALESGEASPLNLFLAVRLWDPNHETLISRAEMVRHGFATMGGATCHLATNPATAMQLWFQTWPGWTGSPYRGFDLPADDATVANLLPWTVGFCGRLEGAEALYESPRGSLVGVSTQVNGVPQSFVIFGQIGVGKSLLLTDLLAQIAHLFDFILIVEENLSHGTTVQALGAEPLVISPHGNVTLNHLDPGKAPWDVIRHGQAVGILAQMAGETGSNADPSRAARVRSCLSDHLQAFYDETWKDWARAHFEEAHPVARRACALERYRQTAMDPSDGPSFTDAWAEVRDLEATGNAGAFQAILEALSDEEVARFKGTPAGAALVRNLGLSLLSPDEAPTHSSLVQMLTLSPLEGSDRALAVDLGERLRAWGRKGLYGRLFDGSTSHRLDGRVLHFELGRIEKAQEELRAVIHRIILSVARREVTLRPRAQRKLLILEEAKRMLESHEGADSISEFYGQMRKFFVSVGAVFQQHAPLADAPKSVRATIMDNAKLIFIGAQPSPEAADELCRALELPPTARGAILRFSSPEHQTAEQKFSSFLMVAPGVGRRLVGTLRLVASREVVYCGKSDGKTFDERNRRLKAYPDVVQGILEEARKQDAL
jgi:hypothetical protein